MSACREKIGSLQLFFLFLLIILLVLETFNMTLGKNKKDLTRDNKTGSCWPLWGLNVAMLLVRPDKALLFVVLLAAPVNDPALP